MPAGFGHGDGFSGDKKGHFNCSCKRLLAKFYGVVTRTITEVDIVYWGSSKDTIDFSANSLSKLIILLIFDRIQYIIFFLLVFFFFI